MFSFEKLKSFNSPAENLGSLGQDAGLANQGAQLAASAGFPCQLHQFEARQEPSAFCDSDVEDIIINSLKIIYIHHAQLGFIPTTKSFSSHREVDLFVRKLLLFAGRDGK